MERQKTVVDSSVVLKWFLQESQSENAAKIKDDLVQERRRVYTIDLVFYEVSNVLFSRKLRLKKSWMFAVR